MSQSTQTPAVRQALFSIQCGRAVAALLVVLFHAAGNLALDKYFGASAAHFERIFWFAGDAGVTFFFVLSGFLLHHVHHPDFNKPHRLPEYLAKRLIRIYPIYLIVFSVVCLSALSVPNFQAGIPNDTWVIVKSLLLIPQDKELIGGTGAPVIVVAWSLQYEVFFYALFSLAIVRQSILLTGAILISLLKLAESFLGAHPFPLSFITSHYVALFGLGVLASAAKQLKPPRFNPLLFSAIGLLGMTLTAIWATIHRENYPKPLIDILYGLWGALFIYAITSWELQHPVKKPIRSLELLGNASYSLYLIHFPAIALLSKLTTLALPSNTPGASVALAILVAGSLASGWILHRMVERPVTLALSKRWRQANLH